MRDPGFDRVLPLPHEQPIETSHLARAAPLQCVIHDLPENSDH